MGPHVVLASSPPPPPRSFFSSLVSRIATPPPVARPPPLVTLPRQRSRPSPRRTPTSRQTSGLTRGSPATPSLSTLTSSTSPRRAATKRCAVGTGQLWLSCFAFLESLDMDTWHLSLPLRP